MYVGSVSILKMDSFAQDRGRLPPDTMEIADIYAARALPRPSLNDEILAIISRLKISFKPAFRRNFRPNRKSDDDGDWRQTALVNAVRKVKEKDDPDYSEIVSNINKLSKTNYTKLMTDFLERIAKRDALFRLRVTTLLFDVGIKSAFYAPMMADAYRDIVNAHADALQDLATQTAMFTKLYDIENVVVVPSSTEAGYDDAIVAWTKQKELKRGFAMYVAELYSRGLVSEETMMGFLKVVVDDLQESSRSAKTPANEEHVDALVRFLAAVAPKVAIKVPIQSILAISRAEVPSLSMKSRFKLEDAMKLSR